MKNSKKNVVQRVKVFKLLSGESNKRNNDLSVMIVDNCLLQITNLFQIPIKKFGLKTG